MKINREGAFCAQVYYPNIEKLQPFRLEFATNPELWGTQNKELQKRILKVSYDGVNPPINCSVCPSGVYIFKKIDFGSNGMVSCRAEYDMMTEEGLQTLVQIIHTDIEISATEGEFFAPVQNPSLLLKPSYNGTKPHLAPIIQLIYPMGPQLDMDYSNNSEQLVKGVKYPGFVGNSKETYCKGFNLKCKVEFLSSENRGYWSVGIPTQNIDCIVSFDGSYKLENGVTASLISFKDMLVYCEYANSHIFIGGRAPLDQVGKTIWIVGVVKYTKQ